MSRTLRTILSLVLVLALLAVGTAQGTPPAQLVVERFAAALNEVDRYTLRQVLSPATTWSELDLHWRVAQGELEPLQRAWMLLDGGVRLETEVVAIVGDGSIVIAHERMWGDFVPEGMAPLRSTTVYVVEGERLTGITRVLAPDQREMLAADSIIGTWRASHGDYARLDADGTYAVYDSLGHYRSDDPSDSGTFVIDGFVAVFISGEDSRRCAPGERTPWTWQAIDDTRTNVNTLLLRDQIECPHYRHNAAASQYVRVAEE
jgi:limonene-1,2-epoxide hydrolase